MGSKVIGFRVPDDLAVQFEQFCEGAGKTTGEVLRKLVDDMLYPESGRKRLEGRRDRLEERGKIEAHEDLSGVMIRLDNLEQQAKDFSERLDLIQVDRGLTDADKEHYDKELDEQGTAIQKAQAQLKELLAKLNANVEVCNQNFKEWGDKVSRLFQFLEAHNHDDDGAVAVSPEKLFKAEVELADKRLGKIEGQPNTIMGKTTRKGYRYLEDLDLSVKE
jgi:DNA repair exonuclease SbcCD ATPase subunit